MSEGICERGCGRATEGKKFVRCRVCAVAFVKGRRHPYAEPCERYVAEPVAHLQHFTCRECGFDSAMHPGSGRVDTVVVLA